MSRNEQPPPTTADWLRHHGLTPGLCLRLLEAVDDVPTHSKADGAVQIACAPEEVWHSCGATLLDRMPQLGSAIETVRHEIPVTFAPKPFKYPRAFTLHDDGHGRPYVHIPWTGRLSDVLATAHEFGHAVQIVASDGRDMPPATREACAIFAETWFSADLSGECPARIPGTQQFLEAQAFHILRHEAHALRRALDTPTTPYDYRWNYPIAQAVVLLWQKQPQTGDIHALFTGHKSLRQLVRDMGL